MLPFPLVQNELNNNYCILDTKKIMAAFFSSILVSLTIKKPGKKQTKSNLTVKSLECITKILATVVTNDIAELLPL